MRINKFLSSSGVCSRREADRLISAGRVTIDGVQAELGSDVAENSVVCVDGRTVRPREETIVIAFHKPVGIICTTSDKERPNLVDAIDYPARLFPVGRLDKDSSGLLLLTNDGDLADELMRSRNDHEKEYIVTTDRPLTDEVVKAMEQGVPILDTMTKPCKITKREGRQFHITLTQGLNRQIRRMCEYFDYKVVSLHRIRFSTVNIGNLEEGKYRKLEQEDVDLLKNTKI